MGQFGNIRLLSYIIDKAMLTSGFEIRSVVSASIVVVEIAG